MVQLHGAVNRPARVQLTVLVEAIDLDQPRRELRPRPQFSFKGRTYAAAVSPESMPIMAELGWQQVENILKRSQ